ncbi:MAG: ABC transporter ATP-binding protein/permease [Leptolyngbya sp. SIO4C1]|nr:ABC transporter ATP-binding protein/permease [Leptolyngbya sp. SIO4C1]
MSQPLWQVIQFYWNQADSRHKRATSLGLLLLVSLSVLSSGALVFESLQRGEFISALAAREAQRFQQSLLVFIGVLLASAILLSVSTYVRDRLGLHWRRGLTQAMLSAYLSQRRFYWLSSLDLDNPDQRITEDIKQVTQTTVIVLGILLDSVVQLIGFIGVLWAISIGLTGFLVLYAVIGSAIATLFFGLRLTRISAEQLKREATFRFGLIELRDQGESIAFEGGQPYVQTELRHRFRQVVRNFNRFIRWQLGLDCFQNGYQYLTFVLPSLILAPRILSGELEVGAIVQSQAAFDRIWLALSLIVVQFEQLTRLAASIERLSDLLQALKQVDQVSSAIKVFPQPHLAAQNLTLRLPERQRTLVQQLSFQLSTQSLLVTGQSGIGKSTLFKAIAGLWTTGSGTIHCPAESILFLPQRPYLMLGTLRQQLLYPQAHPTISDRRLWQILAVVQLSELADLDQQEDWSQRLSVGEQQRLAFARLLIARPAYALLDEATSALSVTQEQALYRHLAKTDITYMSIGHRPSLLPYHQQKLTLLPDSRWQLEPISTPTVAYDPS